MWCCPFIHITEHKQFRESAPLCTLVLHSYSCTTYAPLRNLVHYSCTTTYSRAPISCTTRTRAAIPCTTPTRAPFSCTTPTRAPLGLVHHTALVHRSVISCTTRSPLHTLVHHSCTAKYSRAPVSCTIHAPLRNLVHHSRAPLKYSRALSSCTTFMHHSCRNALSALLKYSRAPLNHS